MKINQILDKIDEKQIFVPAFQREYVWNREDAKRLINSLLKGYPTGSMLTWETHDPPELKGHIYRSEQGTVKIILDGQQRITTLYILIKGKLPYYYKSEEVEHDISNLYVNLLSLELQYYTRSKMANDPIWVDLTDIFQQKIRAHTVIRKLEETGNIIDNDLWAKIDDNIALVQQIVNHDFVEQIIPVRAKINEAIDIFYIVNASGVNLTKAELALAQMSGYWPRAREIFKNKLHEMAKSGFIFELDFIIYILLAILHKSGSEMEKLHSIDNLKNLMKVWSNLEHHTLDYVLNLLRQYAYVDHSKELSSPYPLIPIISYCFNLNEELTHTQIKKMIKWFYYSQIRYRYVSQLPQKLDHDLKIINNSPNPFDELISLIANERQLTIIPSEFDGATTSNPLWSMMRWYFKSNDAVCLTTGVGLRKTMGKSYELEWDHIFSYARLKQKGYGIENRSKYALAQEITNRVVLTKKANRSKSDELADIYLKNVTKNYPHALKLQCIPSNQRLWSIDNFEKFLVMRRKMLSDEINSFLQGFAETESVTSEINIEDILANHENSEVEFKSSLKWNYHTRQSDKKLEDIVIKTIAAFSNSSGGTLIIGVDDEANVLGLENDYITLHGNKDEFERHLRGLCNDSFGVVLTTNLRIHFPKIEGIEVCRVTVDQGAEPIFLKTPEGVEKLFIRNGPSSMEVPTSELSKYLKDRF